MERKRLFAPACCFGQGSRLLTTKLLPKQFFGGSLLSLNNRLNAVSHRLVLPSPEKPTTGPASLFCLSTVQHAIHDLAA